MNEIWVISEERSNKKYSILDTAFYGYFTSEAEAQAKIDSLYWISFNPPLSIESGKIDTPVVLSAPTPIPVEEHGNYPLYSHYVHNEPSEKLLSTMSYMAFPGKEAEILQLICERTSIPCKYNPYGKGYIPGALHHDETRWLMMKIAQILTEDKFYQFTGYARNTTNTQFNWLYPYYNIPEKKANSLNLDYASYAKGDHATVLAATLVNYEDNMFAQYKNDPYQIEGEPTPRSGIHIIDLIVELITGENYAQLAADYAKATQ